MASGAPPGAEPIQIDPAPDYAITRTLPDVLLRHDISDEELDMLCEGRRDNVWEGMWVALGALVGGFTGACASLERYFSNDTAPLAIADLVQIVVFFIAVVVSVILWLVVRRRTSTVFSKQKEIRERTRRRSAG